MRRLFANGLDSVEHKRLMAGHPNHATFLASCALHPILLASYSNCGHESMHSFVTAILLNAVHSQTCSAWYHMQALEGDSCILGPHSEHFI